MIAPQTTFTIDNYPPHWEALVIYGATLNAMDALMISSLFQEKQLIFADKQISAAISTYYGLLQTTISETAKKIKKPTFAPPHSVTGWDIISPPRITGQNWQSWAFLRGAAV